MVRKNHVVPSHEPEKIFEYQSKQSNTRCTSESLEASYGSVKKLDSRDGVQFMETDFLKFWT